MKKKIMALCLVVALAVTAITGATLAYFTDTETKTNTFTMGDVDIQLDEVFPEDELFPGPQNALQKEVTVKNIGSEDAYLWIELWIPAALDNANASLNSLHFNPFDTYEVDGKNVPVKGSVAKENGYKLVAETVEVALGSKTIDGVVYNGYREYIKNDAAKKTGESTYALLAQVYMDAAVEQCTTEGHEDGCLVLKGGEHYTGSWEIIVNAYGIQAEGFDNIEDAIAAYDGE